MPSRLSLDTRRRKKDSTSASDGSSREGKPHRTFSRKQMSLERSSLGPLSTDDASLLTETDKKNQPCLIDAKLDVIATISNHGVASTSSESTCGTEESKPTRLPFGFGFPFEPPFDRTRFKLTLSKPNIKEEFGDSFDVTLKRHEPPQKRRRVTLAQTVIKEEDDSKPVSGCGSILVKTRDPTNDCHQGPALDELEEGVAIENAFAKQITKRRGRPAKARVVTETYYELDYIAANKYENGKMFYLIKWENYTVEQSTWEYSRDVNAERALVFFHVRKRAVRKILPKLRSDQADYASILAAQEKAVVPDKNRWIYLEKQFEWNKVATEANVAAIYIENWSGIWSDSILALTYITHNIYSPLVQEAFDQLQITDADKQHCEKDCKCTATKCCAGYDRSYGYSPSLLSHGLRQLVQFPHGYLIECGPFCGCDQEKCKQRVVQKRRTVPLVVFYEGVRGWGVRTIYKIPKRTFIGEYVGELITLAEARKDDRTTIYQWQLNVRIPTLNGETLVIDAGKYGNEIRFINHSCNPNLRAVQVYCSKYGFYDPVVAVFAIRDIDPGEELTLSYWNSKQRMEAVNASNKMDCRCGTKQCSGWMPAGEEL